jgi:hypothetical protein
VKPTAVIASIHQPSSQIYHTFDRVVLLSRSRALYTGSGGAAPAQHFAPVPANYNIADHLLDIASEVEPHGNGSDTDTLSGIKQVSQGISMHAIGSSSCVRASRWPLASKQTKTKITCEATFLTQLQVLSGREMLLLRRKKTLLLSHIMLAIVLGVYCGGLYFQTGDSIGGFQSRIGSLFFQGALIAFTSLSALYNITEIRQLFVRERSAGYYGFVVLCSYVTRFG